MCNGIRLTLPRCFRTWGTNLNSDLGFKIIRQVPGRTRSMGAPSCEVWRTLANFGEPTMAHSREPPWQSSEFRRRSPTFTRPKGPSRTKNTTDSKFTTGSKFGYGDRKTLRRTFRNHYFYSELKQHITADSRKLLQYRRVHQDYTHS